MIPSNIRPNLRCSWADYKQRPTKLHLCVKFRARQRKHSKGEKKNNPALMEHAFRGRWGGGDNKKVNYLLNGYTCCGKENEADKEDEL